MIPNTCRFKLLALNRYKRVSFTETMFLGCSFDKRERKSTLAFASPTDYTTAHCRSQKVFTSLLISFIITPYKRDGGDAKPETKKKYYSGQTVQKNRPRLSSLPGISLFFYPSFWLFLPRSFALCLLPPLRCLLVCIFSPPCQAESYCCQP